MASGNRGVADTTEWDPDPCSGVYLRTGPGNGNNMVGELTQGTVFSITCRERGGSVTDSRGYASNIWNKATTPGSPPGSPTRGAGRRAGRVGRLIAYLTTSPDSNPSVKMPATGMKPARAAPNGNWSSAIPCVSVSRR